MSFDGSDGGSPTYGALVQGSDGNFYGVGGASGSSGTIFKVTPQAVLTTLYSFATCLPNCPNGAGPNGSLVQGADGNFYGTTAFGGTGFQGTVFTITPQGQLTSLYSFCTQNFCPDGQNPLPLVQGSDGNFYGTTQNGGAKGYGTVFKITPGGQLTTLYSFCSQIEMPNNYCLDGALPGLLVKGGDGNFYGTTLTGGGTDNGSVFKITPAGALTTFYSFCPYVRGQTGCPDGKAPTPVMIAGADGNFYGTTSSLGPNGHGTVFKIPMTGTAAVNRAPSSARTLRWPGTIVLFAPVIPGLVLLILGSVEKKKRRGTTVAWLPLLLLVGLALISLNGCGASSPGSGGGGGGGGTGVNATTLYGFCSQTNSQGYCTDGDGGSVGLEGSDGNIYGTTGTGGANNVGTIFEITSAGQFTTLHSFCSQTNCSDGEYPASGLLQASDGKIYGTAGAGGASGNGAIFYVNPQN